MDNAQEMQVLQSIEQLGNNSCHFFLTVTSSWWQMIKDVLTVHVFKYNSVYVVVQEGTNDGDDIDMLDSD